MAFQLASPAHQFRESPAHQRVIRDIPVQARRLRVEASTHCGGYTPFIFTHSPGEYIATKPGLELRYQKKVITTTGIYFTEWNPPTSTVENRKFRSTYYIHPQIGDFYKFIAEDDKGGSWRTIYTWEIAGDGTIVENTFGHTIVYGIGGAAAYQAAEDYPANGTLASMPPVSYFVETGRTATSRTISVVVPPPDDPANWDAESLLQGQVYELDFGRSRDDALLEAVLLLERIPLDNDTSKFHLYQWPQIADSRGSLGLRWLKPDENDTILPGGTTFNDYYFNWMMVHYMRTASGIVVQYNPYDSSGAEWGETVAGIYQGGGTPMVNDGRYYSGFVSICKSKIVTTNPVHYYNTNSTVIGYEGNVLVSKSFDFGGTKIVFEDPWTLKLIPETPGITPPQIPPGEPPRIPKWYHHYFIYTPDNSVITWANPAIGARFGVFI